MIHRYYEIGVALDFADKYGATGVTIEMDGGDVEFTPREALAAFEELAPGEAFSVLNIAFADTEH
jgi:hypothetical protein